MAATTAAPGRVAQVVRIWQTAIGKKAIMAITGVILFGYTIGHMAGNLQVFISEAKINAYARFLHGTLWLLWGTRVILLVSVILHIWAAVSLTAMSAAARPVGYRKWNARSSSVASRTMFWTGLVLLAFVVFHLLHLTTGTVHPDFKDLQPYHNLVVGLSVIPVGAFYIVAMLCLGFHLIHGVYSLFQSLGLSHPAYSPRVRVFATLFTLLVVGGFLAVPVAVLAGVIK
jgi:succinate dehydrogenase / fumarate reductase, cytochrome b subunit